jgi:integrase
MGLYKLCEHKGRNRDRCEHPWWGSFRGMRVSLSKWANREIHSKAEAGAALDELRIAIRAGTFEPSGLTPAPAKAMTFRELAELYRDRHVIPKRLALAKDYAWSVKPFLERFGDRALTEIKTAVVQDFIADLQKPRIVGRRPGARVLSAARVNRIVDLLRHMLNWAVGREYIERTPFKRGSETLIKKLHEDNKRRRRIDEAEEAALLNAAPPQIQAMLVAAIDTGMRQGEMLALRFADVDLEHGLITLRGETTKSRKTRVVPISTERLRAVVEWLRLDGDGDEKPEEALVFSNEAGEPLRLFHRTWQSIVLRAYGHTPTWAPRLNYQGLSDESQATFRRINLRWHDLRHEYASRLVEHGVPLAQVRDLLGHASITTTERYDNQTLANLKIAAAKLERGHAFAHAARAKFQDSFKIEPPDTGPRAPREVPAIEANELADLDLGAWLGRRDSNPDNRVQSAVSYR